MALKAITSSGREIRISFQHGITTVTKGKNAGKSKRFITCSLWEVEEPFNHDVPCKGKTLGVGTAVCSFQDRFDKETGRQEALNKAIEGIDEGIMGMAWKEIRDAVLKAYFTRKAKGKKVAA